MTIGEKEMEELLPLVQELADRYTGKASTSVTYETAQQLMGAVLYCIREYEQEVSQGQETLPSVQGEKRSLREAYEKGYQSVLKKVQQTRELYNRLVPVFCDYGSRVYRETFLLGIPEFFRWYDARLHPQDTIIMLDYPVLARLEHLDGIDRIAAYVQCIEKEQEFLQRFPETYVREANRMDDPDYEENFGNVCDPVRRRLWEEDEEA